MKLIKLLFITILMAGCASETQQKGLDEIAEIYDAKVSYSKGFNSSLGKKTVKRFNVKLSDSKSLDSLPIAESSANIALTVFKNFDADEKNSYTHIYTEYINPKKDTLSFTFPVSLMETLLLKSKGFTVFSESLKNETFEDVENFKNKDDLPQDIAKFLSNYSKLLNQDYGKITSYQLIGLAELKNKERSMAQYVGYFTFNSGKLIKYAVNVDMINGKDEIVGFRIFK